MNTLSTWDEVDEGGYVIYGSPATVRNRMKECIKEARWCSVNRKMNTVVTRPDTMEIPKTEGAVDERPHDAPHNAGQQPAHERGAGDDERELDRAPAHQLARGADIVERARPP
jgi:hypothetical protein